MVNRLLYQVIPLSTTNPEIVLSAYILNEDVSSIADTKHPAVLILPGAEKPLTKDREADLIALEFTNRGFHAFVLHCPVKAAIRESTRIVEGFSAVAFIRNQAKLWNIDAERIVVCGLSAGIPLAVGQMTLWKDAVILEIIGSSPQQLRPDAGILIHYPNPGMPFEEQPSQTRLDQPVDSETPPAFLWCISGSIPSAENLVASHLTAFAAAMLQNSRPVELHIIATSNQGFSPAAASPASQDLPHPTGEWFEHAQRWLGTMLRIPIQDENLSIQKTGKPEAENLHLDKNGKPVQY